MTNEPHEPALPSTVAGDLSEFRASSTWRRLSIEEASRHGWWDAALRVDASRRAPTTAAKALREWAVAQRLVRHLAECMGWPASHYRGFACLDGITPPDGEAAGMIANSGSNPLSRTDAGATATCLAEKLLECRLMPRGWLLAAIAKDESLPASLILKELGHALQRRGRPLEAAREFDAALAVILQPLREPWGVPDEQITVVENYRRHEIVFCGGRFYAIYANAPAVTHGPPGDPRSGADPSLNGEMLLPPARESDRTATGPRRRSANRLSVLLGSDRGYVQRLSRIYDRLRIQFYHVRYWRRYPVYSGERFRQVVAMIDAAIPKGDGQD